MRMNGRKIRQETTKAAGAAGMMLGIVLMMFFLTVGTTEASQGFCTQTAQALFAACSAGTTDDSFVKKGICINISDATARSQCFNELTTERNDARQLCKEQRDWRLDACKLLGEERYDPNFDPANFENDVRHLTNPNLYFPLKVGNKWKYQSPGETNTVEVLNQTKSIEGVQCIVFRDKVFRDGQLAESTDDWFTQALNKNVWYCGEEVKDYETFEGDNPRRPELVSIDGSFKAGRDGDKAGIIFLASPKKGDVYLEEFSLANAEDVTVILSKSYSFGHSAELDKFVPQQLAQRMCSAGDCVVTKNFSLLEPDVIERKYYARGIGVFLEVELEGGVAIQLIDCNFDNRCAGLPTP
jgi:hypothetical protein